MRRRVIPIAIAAITAFLLIACEIPKYQLYFTIDSVADYGDTIVVSYTLENTGYDALEDATVKMVADFTNGLAPVEISEWTSKRNLSVEESYSGTITLTANTGYSYVDNSVRIESSGWNTDDDGGSWF